MRLNRKTIRRLSKELTHAIPLVMKHWPPVDTKGMSSAIARLSEIWVADKLINFDPKLGNNRPQPAKADIYLANIKKWIEVKASRLRSEGKYHWWDFNFGDGKQIKDKLFDYCVLVCMDEYGKPQSAYVFKINELDLSEWEKRESDRGRKEFVLIICEDLQQYRKLIQHGKKEWDPSWVETKIEEEIHKNPKNYLNRWNKIH